MKNQVTCPGCGFDFDVNEALAHQIEDKLKKDFQQKSIQEDQKIKAAQEQLEFDKQRFEKAKQDENKLFQERLATAVSKERSELEIRLKSKVKEESATEIAELQRELNEKSGLLQDAQKSKAEATRLTREMAELRDKIELETQEKLNSDRDRIRKEERERNELVNRELSKKLEDQIRLTNEMQARQEQGLTQLQGEAMEIFLEEYLRVNFPLDTISEVRKGQRGCDCVQYINTRTHQNVGSIYYESKRTKEFSKEWIDKFKSDLTGHNATFGVLVTDALPKGQEGLAMTNGIWICQIDHFKGLCFVLRESAILLHQATLSQENKGDKMVMLYSYLTSNEFKMQITNIVDGFNQMKIDLDSERRSMESIWKKREKQIEKVLINTTQMHGSLTGIAGSAIESIPLLELGQ